MSAHVTGIESGVESGIKGAFGDVLRGVDTWLDINAARAVNLLVELRGGMRMLDMLYVVGDVGTEIGCLAESGQYGTEEGTEVEALPHLRACLHIDLVEDFRHHALALVVVNGHVLVELLLADVVGDDLAVDDSAHAVGELLFFVALLLFLLLDIVLDFIGCRFRSLLHPDVAHLHISSMLALAVPPLAGRSSPPSRGHWHSPAQGRVSGHDVVLPTGLL
mgnify:CR=1 FL=1